MTAPIGYQLQVYPRHLDGCLALAAWNTSSRLSGQQLLIPTPTGDGR